MRGRDAELLAAGEHLDRLLSGMGVVVVIEGRAGMGKSRLMHEVAVMAERLSMTVGSGVADPGDAIVQLAPLMEALFRGPRPILERDALRDAHASPEQRYWLLQDIEASLERVALDSPVLICLDDLQWADGGTAAALRALPARLSTIPVGWVLATRPGPGSPQLRAALDHLESAGAEMITLGPLDATAVAQLVSDALQAEPDDQLLDMVGRAGGSPYLLVELLSGLRDEGLVRVHDGRAELVESRVPLRVGESMRRRLERVSETARQAAIVAASLGRRFSVDELAAMLGVAPSTLLLPVEELIHSSLLVERGDKLAFPHDLTLEGVRGSVPTSARRALDRQAATVLLAAGALPVEVASHLVASAEPGDEVAITTLLKAAETLGATDAGAAADLGRRALELTPPNHPLRGPLVAGTAVWLHASARGEEAKAFADTALRQVLPPVQEAEVRLSIAGMFSLSPDVRAESCREALALPNLPEKLTGRALALLFHNLVTAGRTAEARVVVDPTRDAVRRSGDLRALFILELAESGLDYAEGRFVRALEMAEAGLRTSLHAGDETRAHLTRQWRCDALTMLDRLDESHELSCEHVADAQRHRQGWALGVFETGRARTLLQMGRIADAAAILEERFPADSAHEFVNALDAAGVVALGRVAIHLGAESLSHQVAQIARVMLEAGAPSVRRHGAWMLALQASADGDALGAHRWLRALGEDDRDWILPRFPMDVADDARLVHIALAANDLDLARQACARARRRSQQNPDVASIAATAAHADGLLHHDLPEVAEAVDLFGRSPRPLAQAGALEDFGLLSIESGRTEAAVEALGRSLVLFAEAGATWDAGRLRGRLRALGVRRRLVSTQRARTGWAAMTDSELAVARLVAQGLTNREVAARLFVSHHTVSGHLRSVYTKLGVNSRVELSRLASMQDLPPY